MKWTIEIAQKILNHTHIDGAEDLLRALESVLPTGYVDAEWRTVGDGAFAEPFGTIRKCLGCGCLVAGGPTNCMRCVSVR